jgi:hypothetical protein
MTCINTICFHRSKFPDIVTNDLAKQFVNFFVNNSRRNNGNICKYALSRKMFSPVSVDKIVGNLLGPNENGVANFLNKTIVAWVVHVVLCWQLLARGYKNENCPNRNLFYHASQTFIICFAQKNNHLTTSTALKKTMTNPFISASVSTSSP